MSCEGTLKIEIIRFQNSRKVYSCRFLGNIEHISHIVLDGVSCVNVRKCDEAVSDTGRLHA